MSRVENKLSLTRSCANTWAKGDSIVIADSEMEAMEIYLIIISSRIHHGLETGLAGKLK